MGFADAYLLKAGLRESLITNDPHSDLKLIVTIPVHNESGLARCLDSLFMALPFESSTSVTDETAQTDEASGSSGSSDSLQTDEASGSSDSLQTFETLETHSRCEVLILINAGASAPAGVLEQNQATLAEVRTWIKAHPHPLVDFHVWLDHSFGPKEAGVGMARKILMDEAVRRFSAVGNPDGIIASMDADTVVDPDYFTALTSHFEELCCDGCSIRFEHPLERLQKEAPGGSLEETVEEGLVEDDFPPAVYKAIAQYELHLHYYVAAVRSTGYPYAFHTVGSAFAVRAGIYCLEGGMNKRQGGEDFYFIQKVAQRGNWSECLSTCVRPSPRPSDRVPFGTGPVVKKLISEGDPDLTGGGDSGLTGGADPGLTGGADPGLTGGADSDLTGGADQGLTGGADSGRSVSALQTYHPEPFEMLKDFFSGIDELYSVSVGDSVSAGDSATPLLSAFLESQKFSTALEEIRSNSGSPEAFRKRFWRWFNMFRIMKFLHYAREHGYPDMDVADAVNRFLSPAKPCTIRELLGLFRANN